MHCPRCGHRQNSDKSRFCTKCGLEIGDVKELLAPELSETKAKRKSEVNRATRQGLTMVFSGFVVILILAILRDFVAIPKSLFAVAVLIFIIGGAIRMSMPSLFGGNNLPKSNDDLLERNLETNKLSGGQLFDKALPEGEYHPLFKTEAKVYDTNELVEPASVTEHTTRQLQKELPLN